MPFVGKPMVANTMSLMDEQTRLNKILTRGVVYSIVWLAGFGSCYALYQGILARRMINENPMLEGNGRAWWCIIVGWAWGSGPAYCRCHRYFQCRDIGLTRAGHYSPRRRAALPAPLSQLLNTLLVRRPCLWLP